jgi:hypothetical protein
MFALVKRFTTGIEWCIAPPEFKHEDGSEFTLCQERYVPAETLTMTRRELARQQEQGMKFCEKCRDEFALALPVLRQKGRAQF